MWAIAVRIAVPLPALAAWRMTRMRGSAAARSARMLAESSVLPSSTQTSSIGRSTGLERTARTIERSVRASL
jgi:hypothetical protein